MLDTMRQLYHLVSSTLSKMLDELNKYAVDVAPRNRSAVGPQLFTLGQNLGLCHHALGSFGKASMGRTDFVRIPRRFSGNTDTRYSRRILLAFTIFLIP